jgi:hypothetical protein
MNQLVNSQRTDSLAQQTRTITSMHEQRDQNDDGDGNAKEEQK